jgi:hypothetical protein
MYAAEKNHVVRDNTKVLNRHLNEAEYAFQDQKKRANSGAHQINESVLVDPEINKPYIVIPEIEILLGIFSEQEATAEIESNTKRTDYQEITRIRLGHKHNTPIRPHDVNIATTIRASQPIQTLPITHCPRDLIRIKINYFPSEKNNMVIARLLLETV